MLYSLHHGAGSSNGEILVSVPVTSLLIIFTFRLITSTGATSVSIPGMVNLYYMSPEWH